MAGAVDSQALPLPRLREDIKLAPSAPTRDGQPSWTLYDPVRHRYLRIGWLEYEILARWHLGTAAPIASAITTETTLAASPQDVMDMLHFLHVAGLLQTSGEQQTQQFLKQWDSGQSAFGHWLLKNYIFLRVRLMNPDQLLQRLHALLAWVFTPRFVAGISVLAAISLILIARQWQSYTHSFMELFSLEGVVEVGIALSFAKIIHELGHGLMAKHFGCRVPSMGVAFVVMWPVLWTDTTDAWRLVNRKQRIAIDAAGMLAEMTLAVFASLAWCVLADGPARTAAFLLSSSTWIITVLVNVNPLMRFDGYYLFSDIIDVPNTQERSFALCRWWLREQVMGLGEAPPEPFAKPMYWMLLAYGFSCWIYRFFLFFGIALLVYHFSFKALGALLMIVEIWWFIAKPVMAELKEWRRNIRVASLHPKQRRSAWISGAALLLTLIPFHTHVTAAGIARAQLQAVIYTAQAGQLVSLATNGTQVKNGDVIVALSSPDIAHRLAQATAEAAGLKAQLSGQSFNPQAVHGLQVSTKEAENAQSKVLAVQSEANSLITHAPFDGIMTDVPYGLRPGEWLSKREMIGILIDPGSQLVEAFVGEADVIRIAVGNEATFLPDNDEAPIPLTVASIASAATGALEIPELASSNGGGIAVRRNADGSMIPETAVYRVLLQPQGKAPAILRKQRGSVTIAGEPVSLMGSLYHRALSLLIRESGL